MQFEYTPIPVDVNLKYVAVTPELASKLLEHNTKNRKIRRTTCESYKLDMMNNRWCQLPDLVEPIIVDWNGILRNGQHRLSAVVETGLTVNMWIVWDADPRVYDYLDGGEKRRAADQMDDSIKNKAGVAALAKFYIAMSEYGAGIGSALSGNIPGFNRRVTRQEIVEYVKKNNGFLQECFNEGQRFSNAIIGKRNTPYMIPGMIVRYLGMGEEYKKFVDEVCSVVSYEETVQLCKGTIMRAASKNGGSLNSRYIVGTILMAFDAFYHGKTVGSLNKQEKYLQKYSELAKARFSEDAEE